MIFFMACIEFRNLFETQFFFSFTCIFHIDASHHAEKLSAEYQSINRPINQASKKTSKHSFYLSINKSY